MKKTFEKGIVAIPCYIDNSSGYYFSTRHIIDTDYNIFELYYDKNSEEILTIDIITESDKKIQLIEDGIKGYENTIKSRGVEVFLTMNMVFISKYMELDDYLIEKIMTYEPLIKGRYRLDENSIYLFKFIKSSKYHYTITNLLEKIPYNLKIKAMLILAENNDIFTYDFKVSDLKTIGYDYKNSFSYFYEKTKTKIDIEIIKNKQEYIEYLLNNEKLHKSLLDFNYSSDFDSAYNTLSTISDLDENIAIQYIDVMLKWNKYRAINDFFQNELLVKSNFKKVCNIISENYIIEKEYDDKYSEKLNFVNNFKNLSNSLADVLIDKDKIDFFVILASMFDKKIFDKIFDKINIDDYSKYISYFVRLGVSLPIDSSRSKKLNEFIDKNKDKIKQINAMSISDIKIFNTFICQNMPEFIINKIIENIKTNMYWLKFNITNKTSINKEKEKIKSILILLGNVSKENKQIDERILTALDIPFLIENKLLLEELEKKKIF